MNELFQNVLTASFHGSIVIVAVILLRLVLKKAPKKFLCFLWLLAGIRLLMPFEIESSLSLQPAVEPVAQVQMRLENDTPELPDSQYSPEPAAVFDTPAQNENTTQNAAPGQTPAPVQSAVPAESATVTTPGAPERKTAVDWGAVVACIWLAVACSFGVYSLASYISLKRKVREAIKIPGGWECDRIDTAFILGFIRPKIYIPMGMSRTVRKHILAHERTHLEKGDHWFKMIGFVALAIHWFNPLVWVAYILLCKDIEMACDERVVQFMELEERKSYSAALLSCSTNRAHFAACPVAFGEVSVKNRIKSVLNYKKPSFWISLAGVIAIIFVAVCLVTSPKETPEDAPANPAAGETTPVKKDADKGKPGFASNLSESEIAYTCEQAVNELKGRESYHISMEQMATSTNQHYGGTNCTGEVRRHGENKLSEYYENGELMAGGPTLAYDGKYAMFYGDKWAWESEDSPWHSDQDADEWLDDYSPQGKTVTFPEGTGVVSGDTVSFFAEWTESGWGSDENYSGTYTYTFHEDGTLASVVKDYAHHISEEDGGGEVHYTVTMTVQEESTEDTAAAIQSVVDQVLTNEELNEYRLMQEIVTEVPSNKTQYDKDFMLGSGTMGWKFMKGEWFFKFGAENVTDTGATLVVETSCQYGNNTVSGGTIEAGAAYFIEQLVDGQWVEVPITADTFTSIQPTVLGIGSRQTINWENNYGKLPAGFYRIGNYYTFTSNTGETDVQVCYAKFRLYDPAMEALLDKCENSLADLLASDSYHLMATSWMNMHRDEEDSHYYTTEVWKAGSDYLDERLYYRHSDNSLKIARGMLRRDGTYYELEWVGDSCRNAVSSWAPVTYPGEDNFQIWSWVYEFYDANVYEVIEEGNTIRIVEMSDFYDDISFTEMIYTFDDAGNLVGLSRAYLYDNGDRLVDEEMVVFDSTKEDVAAFIDSQDLSAIPAFSWAEEQAKYSAGDYEVRTKNFVNTTAKNVTDPMKAIDVAIKDCTLPADVGLEPGTNQSKAFYDAEAGMWKIEFTASWDSRICQLVYLNDKGITQMTVTLEPEAEY